MRAGTESAFRVRAGEPEDLGFLWDMLYEAVHWAPEKTDSRSSREELPSDPAVSHYLEGWGREGDTAVVAVNLEDGRRVGAAWYRLMLPENPGYGFVDTSTPEIGLAVAPDFRGRGVGGMLRRSLVEAARSEDRDALSLSVQRDNPAVKLYERHGFVKLGPNRDAWTMRLDLHAPGGTS